MNGMAKIFWLALSLGWVTAGHAAGFPEANKEAERLYEEGSYAQARAVYASIQTSQLSAEDKRWVHFRLAETLARSEFGSRQKDDSELRRAQTELNEFVQEGSPVDRIWAEAEEALADIELFGRGQRNWGGAWPFYEKALDFWASSTNLTLGAERYWSIVRKAAQPVRPEPRWYYGYDGTHLPFPVLENALKIARNDEEKARAHFMIAMTLRAQGGDWDQRFRIPLEFEAALHLKKDTQWYDDALYFYAEWMSNHGQAIQDENGNGRSEPDFEKALQLFRRLVTEFRKGETQWFEEAQRQIGVISNPALGVSVGNVFLPASEIEFHVTWRNLKNVEFTLYHADLTEDLRFTNGTRGSDSWLESIEANRNRELKKWKKVLKTTRRFGPGEELIRLEEKLPAGAYFLEAKGEGASARELLLVSDASIVIQTASRQAVAYFCDSGSGAPISGADIKLWERYHDGRNWRWKSQQKKADAEGLALFELSGREGQHEIFAAGRAGARQALTLGYSHSPGNEREAWKIYAFTDKPAYRPGEKARWKIVAREQTGERYGVPAGREMVVRLTDPRGAEIKKEKLKLNAFGSAWGEFALKSDSPLGEYYAQFLSADEKRNFGQATLFRLEEYKLPEFKIAIHTPEEHGQKKTFLLGETLEVEIAADYYFGGPVAGAALEVVIHQAPYYRTLTEPREFGWYFSDSASLRRRRSRTSGATRDFEDGRQGESKSPSQNFVRRRK